MESMTRGQAWRFLDMGRRLERATTLLLLLERTLVEHGDAARCSKPCSRSPTAA